MSDIRKSKVITKKEDLDYLLNLSQKQLESYSEFMNAFGVLNGKEPRFNTYDIITIPPNSYGKTDHKNTNSFVTTVGRWWWNKCFIENDLFDILGYINKPMTKKVAKDINMKISYAVLEDKITVEALKRYLNRQQKFQPYSSIICSGFTEKMLTISDIIDKKKQSLLKQYDKELNDPAQKVIATSKIEKELLDFAKEYLKNDPSMDMYESGAKVNFGNNFKNLFVMKGAIKSPDPTEGFEISTSNYVDGISRDDFTTLAKSLTEGVYKRSKKTASGGYIEKLVLRAFQHLKLAPKGSDCHTKNTITVFLDKDMAEAMMYSFIVDGKDLVELTTETLPKYLNKTVKFRFSSLCEWHEHGKICNACIGNLFYRLGVENIGTIAPQVASTVKNRQMKGFHNSTVKLHEIDVNKAFGIE